MNVTWNEDLRPDPDSCPPDCEEAAFDPELIKERRGEVIGTSRSIMGTWYLLVQCEDGKLREVEAGKCQSF